MLGGGCNFAWVVRGGLAVEVAFEQRAEEGKRRVPGNSVPGVRTVFAKSQQKDLYLACLSISRTPVCWVEGRKGEEMLCLAVPKAWVYHRKDPGHVGSTPFRDTHTLRPPRACWAAFGKFYPNGCTASSCLSLKEANS